MSSIIQTLQKKPFLPTTMAASNKSLPVSQPAGNEQGGSLRRRLSSLSLKIQPMSAQTKSWAFQFQRSKSVSSMGEYAGTSIRKWWDWSWSWILSRKPPFAQDLEMNEEETTILGSHNKGSWRHVFYKVRSEIRKRMGSGKVDLPRTCKYNSFHYSKNLDSTSAKIFQD